MRAGIMVAGLMAISAVPPSPRAGVLVGVHRRVDYAMQSGTDRQPPAGGELRTIWLSTDGDGPVPPIEIPDLLLPRRSGFWRVGLLGSCAEEPYLDADDKSMGMEAVFADYLWAVPVGQRPQIRVSKANWLGIPERVGPCASTDVYCGVDRRTTIYWIWPEYFSLDQGIESGCGAHPDASFAYSVQRPENVSELTMAEVLGGASERRLRRAFDIAAKEASDCSEQPQFNPSSWHVERVPGGWKAVGWSDTHRLCGFGVDFTADVDLRSITGRTDDRARWAPLKKTMPQLTDAHFSPDGRWIVATTASELLFFDRAAPERIRARMPLGEADSLVMVEWATGPHIERWRDEVERVRATGAVKPVVIR